MKYSVIQWARKEGCIAGRCTNSETESYPMPENTPLSTESEMLRLMKLREEREARREEKEELAAMKAAEEYEAKVERRKSGDKYMQTQLEMKQFKCDHRKGTSGSGRKFKHIDYMVNRNTFQNGVTRIKCEKCRFKWFPGDTKENAAGTMENCLAKKRFPNPTRLSYAEAWAMTNEENTTNTPSRAEMVTTGPAPVTP